MWQLPVAFAVERTPSDCRVASAFRVNKQGERSSGCIRASGGVETESQSTVGRVGAAATIGNERRKAGSGVEIARIANERTIANSSVGQSRNNHPDSCCARSAGWTCWTNGACCARSAGWTYWPNGACCAGSAGWTYWPNGACCAGSAGWTYWSNGAYCARSAGWTCWTYQDTHIRAPQLAGRRIHQHCLVRCRGTHCSDSSQKYPRMNCQVANADHA